MRRAPLTPTDPADPFAAGGWQDNDAILLNAERGFRDIGAQIHALAISDDPDADAAIARLEEVEGEHYATLRAIPPSTGVGAAVKLRALIGSRGILGGTGDDDVLCIQQVLEWLEQNGAS